MGFKFKAMVQKKTLYDISNLYSKNILILVLPLEKVLQTGPQNFN